MVAVSDSALLHGEAAHAIDLAPLAWHALATSLPRYSTEQARLHRLAHDARLMPALRARLPQLAHSELHLSAQVAAPAACCWIELGTADEHCWLGLDASLAPALYSLVRDSPPTETATPLALRLAIATQLLAPLLHALPSLFLARLEVRSLAERPSAAHDCWRIALHRDDEPPLQAWLAAAPNSWIECLERHLAAHGDGLAALATISLPGQLLLGQLSLRIQTMRVWQAGDVIIKPLPQARALRDGLPFPTQLRWSGAATPHTRRFLQTTVQVDGDRIICNEVPHMTQELNEDVPDPDSSEVTQAFGEVELPVQIEVATLALPATEIVALRPGKILTLPTPVRDAAVRLTVYGQLVAIGELVCVGEHLGIRIRDTVHT